MNELERLQLDFDWNIVERAQARNGIWQCTARSTDSISYPDQGADACHEIETNSFWFLHRNDVISSLLKQTGNTSVLWEVGAGTGAVAQHLSETGTEVVALEPDPHAVTIAAKKHISTVVCGFYQDLELPENSIPAIGSFDVLEHLEQPETLVAEFHRTLAPCGHAMITVPAFQWLWNEMDELAQHHRRYTAAKLDRLFIDAGFEKISSGYFMASLVPPYFLFRRLPYLIRKTNDESKLEEKAKKQLMGFVGKIGNICIHSLLGAEQRLAQLLPLPFGTSVFGLYRKPDRS